MCAILWAHKNLGDGEVRILHFMLSGAAVGLLAIAAGYTNDAVKPMGTVNNAQFVVSDGCKGCHADEFETWKDTYHSKMVCTSTDGLLKDAQDNRFKEAKGNAGPTKATRVLSPARAHGRPALRAPATSNSVTRCAV